MFTTTTTRSSSSSSSFWERKRNAKACENCRRRRVRCGPPYPCKPCRDANLDDCHVRVKARPSRAPVGSQLALPQNARGISSPAESPSSNAVAGPSTRHNTAPQEHFVVAIEREMEELYLAKTGSHLSFTLLDTDTCPFLSLSYPLPPLPSISIESGLEILQTFSNAVLPMFAFLTPHAVTDLYARHITLPGSLRGDQVGILFAALALGKLRSLAVAVDESEGSGIRQVPLSEDIECRDDVAWYRHALCQLETWGSTSFDALKCLTLLQFYIMCTGKVIYTQQLISRMVWHVKDGLNILTPDTATIYPPENHADLLAFYVIWGDCYYSAMTGQPPFLKYGEFDPDLLRGGSSSKAKIDNDDPSNHPLLPRPSVLIDQLILQSEILAQLHFQGTDAAGEKFISEVEGKWYKWSNDHSKKLLEPDATEEFYVRVHYHWDRIMIRAGSLNDPSRSVISIALMARSAAQIIFAYEKMYRTGKQNLPWPQVRRTCTAAEIILLAYSRYELDRREAGNLMIIALGLMRTQGVRWKSAAEVRGCLIQLSEALSLPIKVSSDEYEAPAGPTIQLEMSTGSSSTFRAGEAIPFSINQEAFDEATLSYSNAFLLQDSASYGGTIEQGYWDPFADIRDDTGLVEWGNIFV